MTLCMVPLMPPVKDIDLGKRDYDLKCGTVPLSGNNWDHWHDAEHFATFLPQRDTQGNESSKSQTVIRVDGCIFSADVMRRQGVKELADGAKHNLEWEGQERKTIMKVADYLKLMRELGVQGPVWVAISLLHVKDSFLVADRFGWIDRQRAYKDATLRAKTVELMADLDGTDRMAVAKAMKPICDYIWRAAGARNCPYFDDDETYRLTG